MNKYFAWFFFVSGIVGLTKMVIALIEGAPQDMSSLELWSGWLSALSVSALCFYFWDRWR